jgi:hypothetical protein
MGPVALLDGTGVTVPLSLYSVRRPPAPQSSVELPPQGTLQSESPFGDKTDPAARAFPQ